MNASPQGPIPESAFGMLRSIGGCVLGLWVKAEQKILQVPTKR